MSKQPEPDIKEGIEYWNTQPASLDGVLGGLGSGSLPRVDAVGSRLFLLNILPELCTVPSALRPLSPPSTPGYRTRALDVGAGIGRVTADVLLPLVSDVVLLEPVDHFVQEALTRGRNNPMAPGSLPSNQLAFTSSMKKFKEALKKGFTQLKCMHFAREPRYG
ncbi:hypothetical protein CCMSSC00406_0005004 [Pleurotus cornucopiae]|uniref:Uncharacterized protein n=1 Tax=Pleurotus cornucopiae TaxID=5321 RepID=A0ACB7J9M4_PLECO|nr:hypothetical protein CCMSSC00406_0005004 [Pleurotus cornucopiae]